MTSRVFYAEMAMESGIIPFILEKYYSYRPLLLGENPVSLRLRL